MGAATERTVGAGRPQIHDDAEILEAALVAFSESGYDAMSLRSLSRQLGLSHGAINQRFGSKANLFTAAVDHGFGGLLADMATLIPGDDRAAGGITAVRGAVRAFLLASGGRPELARVMNREGLHDNDRLDHIWTNHIAPAFTPVIEELRASAARGETRPVSGRAFFFLLTHGAAAPYTLAGLSERFDATDGPFDAVAHAEQMTDLLIGALQVR